MRSFRQHTALRSRIILAFGSDTFVRPGQCLEEAVSAFAPEKPIFYADRVVVDGADDLSKYLDGVGGPLFEG